MHLRLECRISGQGLMGTRGRARSMDRGSRARSQGVIGRNRLENSDVGKSRGRHVNEEKEGEWDHDVYIDLFSTPIR